MSQANERRVVFTFNKQCQQSFKYRLLRRSAVIWQGVPVSCILPSVSWAVALAGQHWPVDGIEVVGRGM